jgi:nucleoid-associated protein YejK
MIVNHLIIHNLKKEQQDKASLIISEEVLESGDKKTVSLLEELNNCFHDSYLYGIFTDMEGAEVSFQSELDKYLKASVKQRKQSFIEMSKATVNMLYNRVDGIQQAKGGYIVFADYTDQKNNRFFSAFLIRDKAGKAFALSKHTYTINEVIHADTNKLAMACRINIKNYKNRLQNPTGNYLVYISVRQPETSQYFLDWIGTERKKRNTEDSKSLVLILNTIETPDGEDGNPINREDFCEQAYSAIRSFGKNEVNINALSTALFGDETTIMEYANENEHELSSEFVADRKIVYHLIKRFISADKMTLNYPPQYYGDKVTISKKNPNLVIIKSEAFAKAVIRQEEEYGQGRGD